MSAISVTAHQSAHASTCDDAIGRRVPASVGVVELGLGDAIFDVDRSEEELALVCHARSRNQSAHASSHEIGGTHDAIGRRVRASVDIVELGLGDAVVDVDDSEEEHALVRHLRNRTPKRACLQS